MRRGLAALVGMVLAVALSVAPARADEGLSLTWHVDALEPLTVELTVTNESDRVLTGWDVSVPFPHLVTDVTGAVSVQDDRELTLSSLRELAPGASTTVHLRVAALGPAPLGPASCTTRAPLDCTVAANSDEPRALPSPSPSVAPSAQLELDYRVVDDWGSGQSVEVSVTNASATAADTWSVAIPAGVHVVSLTGAASTSGGGVIRAVGHDYLAPGDTVAFTATVEPGRSAAWTECRAVIDGYPAGCTITAADSWLRYPELPGW
ncbi:MAG: cellulose binding domain-containing protein [Candidatus Nanopelagicales bacterium]